MVYMGYNETSYSDWIPMENQKPSAARKIARTANDFVVLGALTYSAYTLARLAYDGTKAAVNTLKDHKNQNEN